MKTRTVLAMTFIVATALAGCRSSTERENEALRERVQELSAKVSTLEADNGRLKEQIRLLTVATDSLSGAMKLQQTLGTKPAATPAPSPSPTPSPD